MNIKKLIFVFALLGSTLNMACQKSELPKAKDGIDELSSESNQGIVDSQGRIANGSLVKDKDLIESVVRLQITDENSMVYLCTGTVVSRQVILTAAHCMFTELGQAKPKDISIFQGYGSSEKYLGKAHRTIVHNDFDIEKMDNDIALVIMNPPKDVQLKPINKVGSVSQLKSNSKMSVVGFGSFANKYNLQMKLYINSQILFQFYHPEYLMTLEKTVVNKKTYYKEVRYDFNDASMSPYGKFTTREWLGKMGSNGLYSSAKPIGSCGGDSGGPVLLGTKNNYTIAGITSFGFTPFEEQNCGGGSIYTAVQDYLDWININASNAGFDVNIQ